jgi:hypothetical protein
MTSTSLRIELEEATPVSPVCLTKEQCVRCEGETIRARFSTNRIQLLARFVEPGRASTSSAKDNI